MSWKARKWKPQYTLERNDGPVYYDVPGCETQECPISYITAESQELLEVMSEALLCREAGASLCGPDLSQWDARLVDALVTVEGCRNLKQNAEMEAIRSHA